jgi:hypothetical protein
VVVQRSELNLIQRLLVEFAESLGVQPNLGQQ